MSFEIVPSAVFKYDLVISNSRFIATIGPAIDIASAKEFITKISADFQDASHNVPVYLIGHGSSVVSHCSDAGEPSGTAGRPALAVLSGSGLGDTALVISRYFGGTKLGTGGLVKAYSESARGAILGVPKAKKVFVNHAKLTVPYNLYEPVIRLITNYSGSIDAENFSEVVSIKYKIPVENFDLLEADLREISQGSLKSDIISRQQVSLLPISP